MASCSSFEPAELLSLEPLLAPTVASVPAALQGHGLTPFVQADFDRPSLGQVDARFAVRLQGQNTVDVGPAEWVSSEMLRFTVPGGLVPGSYSVHVRTPRGEDLRAPAPIEVADDVKPDGGRVEGAWGLAMAATDGGVDWLTAAAFGEGQVWLAGRDTVKLIDGASVNDGSIDCVGAWSASWADAVTGTVYLGGIGNSGGRLATHETNAAGCQNARRAGAAVVGLWGERDERGQLTLFGQTAAGAVLRWRPGATANDYDERGEAPPGQGLEVRAFAAASSQTFFAAGLDTKPRRLPKAWRRDGFEGDRIDLHVERVDGVGTRGLNALSPVNEQLFYTGGEDGLVLEWESGQWRMLPTLGQAEVRALKAFGKNRLWAATSSGEVWRWNGLAWSQRIRVPGITFNALAGVYELDLWAAGAGGAVAHYPQPLP